MALKPLLLALGCFSLVGCGLLGEVAQRAAIANAQFSLQQLKLVNADVPFLTPDAKANFQLGVGVNNPNQIPAQLDKLDYAIALDGTQVGTGSLNQNFSVGPDATGTLTLPVSVPYAGLPSALVSAIQNRQTTVTLSGTSHLDFSIAGVSVPLDVPVSVSRTFSF
ncbi:MAG TPA: LEA type 2 family protein [Oscillatoriaceae cyanobacterium]